MLLNELVKKSAAPTSQYNKKELQRFLLDTRLAVSFKYFKSQKYLKAETLQGKDKQQLINPVFTFYVC